MTITIPTSLEFYLWIGFYFSICVLVMTPSFFNFLRNRLKVHLVKFLWILGIVERVFDLVDKFKAVLLVVPLVFVSVVIVEQEKQRSATEKYTQAQKELASTVAETEEREKSLIEKHARHSSNITIDLVASPSNEEHIAKQERLKKLYEEEKVQDMKEFLEKLNNPNKPGILAGLIKDKNSTDCTNSSEIRLDNSSVVR